MQHFVNHFIDPQHSLTLCNGEKKPWNSLKCVICFLKPSEHLNECQSGKQVRCFVYGCRECRFVIHLDCAKLPQKLSHPFHPQHSLSLFHTKSPENKKRLSCHGCGESCLINGKHVYHCAESGCDFYLDSHCSELQPLNDGQPKHQINSHQHPLFVCNQPTAFESPCSLCQSSFSKTDLIYVCVDCKRLLHESCVFPQKIMHPFHREHCQLYLQQPRLIMINDKAICSACSQKCSSFVSCSECHIKLDLSCFSLKPKQTSSEYDRKLQNQPLTHQHPLIQCDPIKDQPSCSGCYLPIKDFIYVCLDCGILLDKSCAQLPPKITSLLHRGHELTLETRRLKPRSTFEKCGYRCQLCCGEHRLFYTCHDCKFFVDTRCLVSAKPYAIVEYSRIHSDHPLAFFTKKPEYDWVVAKCSVCTETCEKYFFKCFICDYRIHLECCPSLPRVIKHDSHCDPLTFTEYRIKDASDEDSDEEFYCHACEDLRDLDDPTYYCKECHFVAHLHCVFTAILQGLEAESTASSSSSQASQFLILSEPSPFVPEPTERPPSSSQASQQGIGHEGHVGIAEDLKGSC